MGERNHPSSLGIISQRSLFCLFTIASVMFALSWFFVLRSASQPQFIYNSLLPSNKLLGSSSGGDQARDDPDPDPVESDSISGPNVGREVVGLPPRIKLDMKCITNNDRILKVFMYDLPVEFHFELLGWKPPGDSVWPDIRTVIPEYPGGLNLQHSIEFWLTLDLLSSEFASSLDGRSAVRVRNSSDADVIFVPFFSSLSYNRFSKRNPHQKVSRNKELQDKLVKYLTSQEEWKRFGGRDHVIMAHHPNSMLDARVKLWPAMYILADFGRYPPNVANVEKDLIAPYKHLIRTFSNDTSDFDSRLTLLYFQGAIYRKDGGLARQELFYLLKDEKDVHFSFGSVLNDGINRASEGMHSSKFCLNIAGDTPSSNRLFDAIASHCVPVIIGDQIELPYEDVLDYSEFCIFVKTSDAIKENFLIDLIRGIGKEEWTRMWNRLKEVEKMYEYQYPSSEGDAVQMIWQAISRKVPKVRMNIHRSSRFDRYIGGVSDQNVKPKMNIPKNFW